MKHLEYYYNVIYYFFYRGAIKMFYGMDVLLYPLRKFLFLLAKTLPSVQRRYEKRGIKNPEEWFHKWNTNITENPSLSLATMYGAGLTIGSLMGFYVGFYKIFHNLFFPDFQDVFKYVLIPCAILAWLTHGVLSRGILESGKDEQGEKYIKQFNQIKDKRWRLKWALITALTFPSSIVFMVYTSKSFPIGHLFFELHNYLF
jgi:hypothetical protein